MNSSRKKSTQKPVCLMVLGPHRSGTSALSGVLSHLGGDVPKTLMPAGEGNAEGYFESVRVMAFNDRLLNALGSDWKDLSPLDPGSTTAQVFEGLMAEAVQVLQEEFSAARLPLLKDPRICRFVGFWSEAFSRAGYEPLYIHTHRNPLETAQSLQKRDGIPIELGLLIWLRHVLDAEAATRGRTRAFTNYKALLEDWRAQISQMEQTLGLIFHRNTGKVRQSIDDFLSDSLRNQQRTSEDVRRSAQVADVVRETFQIFESWAGGAGEASDHDALDALRGRMDGALDQVTTFARALDAAKELASELKVVEQRAQLLQDEKLALATELERDRKAGAERVTKIAELEQRVEVFQGEAIRLTAELEHDRKAGVERGAEQAARATELEGALRQRSLEAEEWFEENGRLAQAHAALQAEMKKLEDERDEELGRLQESLRSRDSQIRILEKNIEDRFEEIVHVSQMLLEAQSQQEEDRFALRQANNIIDALVKKNEQLKRVGIKKLMARYSRKIRLSMRGVFNPS